MIEYIMHKNEIVAKIDCISGYIKDIEIINIKLMPFIVTNDKNKMNRDFTQWKRSRCIPYELQSFNNTTFFANEVKQTKNMFNASLTDCYWIKPYNYINVKWEDINYFDNKIFVSSNKIKLTDDNFKKYFDCTNLLKQYNIDNPHSPKFIKYFTIDNDNKYCIVKNENLYNNAQDVYNEIIGNVLCDNLDIPHADYYILPYNIVYNKQIIELPLITCELCVQDENAECITIENLIRSNIVSEDNLYYDLINIGMSDFLNKMLTLDFILMNPSRDLSNFGIIRDSETLQMIDIMPIYDCGASFNYTKEKHFKNDNTIDYSKPFKLRHSEQINLVTSFEWLDMNDLYESIPEIEAILSYSPIPQTRQNEILDILLQRIQLLEQYIKLRKYKTKGNQQISNYRKIENIKRRFDIDKIKEISGFDPTISCDTNKIFFTFLTEEGKNEFNQFELFNPNLKERFEHFKKDTFGI